MSIQHNEFRLSVHTNAMIADDCYHVRLVTPADKIQLLLDAVLSVKGENGYIVAGHAQVGGLGVEILEGDTWDEKVQWAFGNVDEFDSFWWNIERRGDEYYLDFNIAKARNQVDRLDPVIGMTDRLPSDFWVEPAAVIRAIMGKRGLN
ncbi:hypothetical protein [Agrobacterium sp. CG674]